MNVFVIGKFDSIYMYQYVKEVLCADGFERNKKYYFFHSGKEISDTYIKYYNKVADKIYYEKPHRWIRDSLKEALNDAGDIDVIHIHYIQLWYYSAIKKNKKESCRLILTAWGSDLLRLPKKYYKRMKKFIYISDCIVVGTNNLKSFLLNNISDKIENKIVKARFGTPVIDEIVNLRNNNVKKIDLKLKYIGNLNKVIITCGYNGSEFQQHDKIINALSELNNSYKKDIFLHIPMGYGTTSEYYVYIEGLLNKSGFEYKIDKKFYAPDEMAKIRIITDIFIHGQTTDASSSSVFEYVYAGALLVNGKWLKYPELDQYGILYEEFEDFSQLSDIIQKIIMNDITSNINKDKCNNLLKTRSWKYLRRDWQELY